MKKVMVILGSVRNGRAGDNVIKQLKKELDVHTDIEWEYMDLKDLDLPFYDQASPPVAIAAGMGDYTNPKGREWADQVGSFDGFIFVFPEYNHSIPAVLKNAFEWVAKEWEYKPLAMVGYGAVSGGIRAIQAMRLIALERRMFPLHDAVHIPHVYAAFNEEGDWKDELQKNQDAFAPMVAELKAFLAAYNSAT